MSFNRRGNDRRNDRPYDRPARRPPGPQGGGDWQRDRPPRGDRPPLPRGGPRYDRAPDEGAMAIRLDPRRVGTLKQLAAEAGMRPGDLVRQWVEERIDAARGGARPDAGGNDRILGLIAALEARLAALEATAGATTTASAAEPAAAEPEAAAAPAASEAPAETDGKRPARRKRVSAAPSGPKVALHDEMIAVLRERGPLTAAELAAAVAERGKYAPPRTAKPLDAAMVSQRVSNPTYRSRFTRENGRIGLA
jgi:hypothetical protein